MKKLIFLPLLLVSCTVSTIVTDTHGVADDVVDSTPTTEVTPDVDVSVPIPAP